MDEKRFDLVVRARAEGASRRSVLKGLFGGPVGGAALTAPLLADKGPICCIVFLQTDRKVCGVDS